MFLYLANWGSKQLAFRFPKTAVDQAMLQPYSYGVEEIELTAVGDYVILDIAFHEEGGGDWIEEEPRIAPLAPLRDDILRGDLRALYLAWLNSASRYGGGEYDDEVDDDDEEEDGQDGLIEPLVPPGLGQLSAPLQAFADFFEIDQDLIVAAAQNSPPLKTTSEPLEQWVPLLPETERTMFLVRAARGQPIAPELLRRLREVGDAPRPAPSTATRRTFAAIEEAAEEVRRQRKAREQRAAEQKRIAKLDALAAREEQVWASIPGLLAQRNANGYGQAVADLAELRDLAAHRNQRQAFDARLAEVVAPYIGSAALVRRLKEKKLT